MKVHSCLGNLGKRWYDFFFLVFADFVFVTFVSIQLALFSIDLSIDRQQMASVMRKCCLQRLDSIWESKQVNLFY